MPPGTALISASHKDDKLAEFAHQLSLAGWKLLASKGTREFLDRHRVPSTDIGDMVGPPILGHRVVTLDRKIYAAILARLDDPNDMAELRHLKVEPIHLVYVDLYPLADELSNSKHTFESVIEKIDIGGPTLLRAAAKGGRVVVSSPKQFESVLRFIKLGEMPSIDSRLYLGRFAAEAEKIVSDYAALAASFYEAVGKGRYS